MQNDLAILYVIDKTEHDFTTKFSSQKGLKAHIHTQIFDILYILKNTKL